MENQDNNRKEYNITIYVENHVGLLSRIAIIFTRRKINISSLNTSPSEVEGIHRIGIVISESDQVVNKLARHLGKITEVLKVYYHTNEHVIWQELALYKISTDIITEKINIERLLRAHGARAVVIRNDYTIFEATGQTKETEELIRILQPYGLIEFVRSGRVAIIKDSEGFSAKLKDFEQSDPGEKATPNEYLNKGAGIFSM